MHLKKLNSRALAAKMITSILQEKISLTQAVSLISQEKFEDPKDTGFIKALIFGVLRRYPQLKFISHQLMQKEIKSKEVLVLNLICVGLFQLREMRVSEHAAVSETVEAAKQLNKAWSAKLINAVLRNYQRQKDTIKEKLLLDIEAYYAHPIWFIDALKKAWPNDWQTILDANNAPPPLSLRVNQRKLSREDYVALLKTKNLEAKIISNTDFGIILEPPQEISTLPGYQEGFFSVQDGAAQFSASLLDLKPNLKILDACAAPGGKTTHILETEPRLTKVVALDISKERIRIIQENLARLQLTADVKVGDALTPSEWSEGQLFDRILLDAPCSSTGVIRRHPDIKHLRKFEDIKKLSSLQFQLIKALWPLLKPNGIFLYVTCSILPEENNNVIEAFLNSQGDAQLYPFDIPGGNTLSLGIQLLPGQNEMDGFYYARMMKKS